MMGVWKRCTMAISRFQRELDEKVFTDVHGEDRIFMRHVTLPLSPRTSDENAAPPPPEPVEEQQ
ncbi:hypothetical protein KIN20_008249 [Parelaphostrongylus tenuis]|uniref:Uncharacterized protein n=1 Tax=Parelaphostrongylus tenuis TaxID=148309 RepID=A0AAD5QKJ2_PARTN|nr:hypothetical protein KIN20_008249 [Parelaphostrongylus tenuis]